MRVFGLIICLFLLSACATELTTRESKMSSRKSTVAPISKVRKQNAELTNKLMNYEEDLRIKDGRIEELEVYIKQLEDQNKKELKSITEERDAYKESLNSMNKEKVNLMKNIALMKEDQKEASEQLKIAKTPASEVLKTGDKLFEQKKWTEAVTAYQTYREKSPKKNTSDYALATYKIGVCFQELGLTKEAKTFYKSVVNGFDKNFKAHKYASYRLSELSK